MALTRRLNTGEFIEKLFGPEDIGSSGAQANQQPKPTSAEQSLHALIIGINQYQLDTHRLAGAVPDAQAFASYLIEARKVPGNRINLILDEQAKRADIINAFQQLAENHDIQRGDPIVIYYAGHGGEIDSPNQTAGHQLMKCIIPQDTSKDNGVMPIPDSTIGTLVCRIAQNKGSNITLIFDCCYSVGEPRDSRENARFVDKVDLPEVRAWPDPGIVPDPLSAPLGLSCDDMGSHVLLAACGHREMAFEDPTENRGYFSRALLTVLRAAQGDRITYKQCIQSLPDLPTIRPQNPVCSGKNVYRRLFNAKVPGANPTFIMIKSNDSNKFHLQAGFADGIAPGDKFAIYEGDISCPISPSRGTLIVDTVEQFESHLKGASTLSLPPIICGRQVGDGPDHLLDIHITPEFIEYVGSAGSGRRHDWVKAFSGGEGELFLRPVERKQASVILSVDEKKKTTFTLTNQATMQYGVQELPPRSHPGDHPSALYVKRVLNALCRWNWSLGLVPDSRPFWDAIDLQFYKLRFTGEFTESGQPIYDPEGKDLNVEGVVDIVPTKKDRYGVRISNRSKQDLHAYLFFISATSLAVNGSYNPLVSSQPSGHILAKQSKLMIGYGPGKKLPLLFSIHDKMDLDLDFLKLFVSTSPLQSPAIEQGSPFERDHEFSTSGVKACFTEAVEWDTFTVTIAQRRHSKKQQLAPGSPPQEVALSVPGQTDVLSSIQSQEPLLVLSRSAVAVKKPWFRTLKLTEERLTTSRGIRLRTLARQRGPPGATATPSTGAYFEISIIGSDGLPKHTSPNEETITYRSHSPLPQSSYGWSQGQGFYDEIWRKLAVGDCLEVLVCSRGRGWENDAAEGHLDFL